MSHKLCSAQKLAGLSIDVDSVTSHLAGYGIQDFSEQENKAYTVAIPRAIEIFARHEAKGTFFLIASEAANYPQIVNLIIDSGHEVASHSMTHCLPFSLEEPEIRRREIEESKRLLENLAGKPVTGFRAPSWDVSEILLNSLSEAGYRYDSSSYPSWMLALLRYQVAKLTGQKLKRLGVSWEKCLFSPASPHRLSNGLIEIPVSTTLGLRIPYYHTLRLLLPGWVFQWIHRFADLRATPINYIFHAVDFLSIDEDRLDPRISRHPGMNLPLAEKLNLAESNVSELAKTRSIVTLEEIASKQAKSEFRPRQ